ncbi:MAG: ribonuclease III [candidate division Zixibacteria bacterium]|nr:ribonuclease III [candidate division Zixibacteria bacterium]
MSFLERLRSILGVGPHRVSSQPDLEAVQRTLGYQFHDESLLLLGLTHRSFSHSDRNDLPSNERMEFLGDSVLGLIIADQLFRDHPDIREGALTKTKAMLVNEVTLAAVGTGIGLNRFIRLSPEEDRSGGRERPSIVSDAFESVIAAVYLDGGMEAARRLVLRLIYSRREEITSDSSQRNYKGELLELTQSHEEGIPHYEVSSEKGPDHCKMFTVVVLVRNQVVGSGSGSSKKEAEQQAAAEALRHYTTSS